MDNTPVAKILIIDDDRQLQENLQTVFSANGFATHSLYNGQDVINTIAREQADVVLLDVMLPEGVDGFDVLRQIRSEFDLPVLMITARGKEIDTVVGLESGADDYLAKPFRMLELLARVRAVMRRTTNVLKTAGISNNVIQADGFVLDTDAYSLSRDDRRVELSATEVKLLEALMENSGNVLQRDALLTLIFGGDYHTTNRNIDVHVSHIRASLRELAPELSPIRTVWGSGYRWVGNG